MQIEFVDEEDERTAHTAEKQLDAVSFNAGAEVRFCVLLCALVEGGSELSVLDAVREASYELDISPETARRYLLKHSARRAQFSIADGFVRRR